ERGDDHRKDGADGAPGDPGREARCHATEGVDLVVDEGHEGRGGPVGDERNDCPGRCEDDGQYCVGDHSPPPGAGAAPPPPKWMPWRPKAPRNMFTQRMAPPR